MKPALPKLRQYLKIIRYCAEHGKHDDLFVYIEKMEKILEKAKVPNE